MGRTEGADMTATVRHAPLVTYHGTLTAEHGLWFVTDNTGGRYTLRTAHGGKLRRVRPTNVTPVNTPTFTEHRAWALRDLAEKQAAPDARTWKWLVANKLAETDPTDGRKVTWLGFVLAAGLKGW